MEEAGAEESPVERATERTANAVSPPEVKMEVSVPLMGPPNGLQQHSPSLAISNYIFNSAVAIAAEAAAKANAQQQQRAGTRREPVQQQQPWLFYIGDNSIQLLPLLKVREWA